MKRISLNGCVGIKIHYEDGSVVRLPMGQIKAGWKVAPDFGVQVVAVHHKNGCAAWFASHDYYALTRDELIETNLPSEIPDGAMVKQGSEMDKDAFRELYNRVMADREF